MYDDVKCIGTLRGCDSDHKYHVGHVTICLVLHLFFLFFFLNSIILAFYRGLYLYGFITFG